jgi:valyl-tRNA synthetase
VYLELAKPILFGKVGDEASKKNKQKLLGILLSNALRLMHPIAPFITEELFSRLKDRFPRLAPSSAADLYTQETVAALRSPACIQAPYPTLIDINDINEETEATFATVQAIVRAIRNLRAEMQIPPQEKTDVMFSGGAATPEVQIARAYQAIILALTPTRALLFDVKPSGFGATTLVGTLTMTIPLPDSLVEKEKQRLQKELEKAERLLESTRAKLAQPEFRARAPQELVAKLETTAEQTERLIAEIHTKRQSLK